MDADAEVMSVDLPGNRTRIFLIFILLVVFSIEKPLFWLFYQHRMVRITLNLKYWITD